MSNVQVLIIEDAVDTRLNIAEILQSDGFAVLEASDGIVGLQLAHSNLPDIILCDIVMPIVDGYDVLKQIRSDPRTALIPFVFLTGKDKRSEQRQGMSLGADDYLAKPFRRHELLEMLHGQLIKYAQRNQWCRQSCEAQQINHQQTLQAQLQVLQLREQETQAWISGITHDLRAPLTTIKVALELLQQKPEQSDRYFTIARQACSQSDALIEELLALYREEEVKKKNLDPDQEETSVQASKVTINQSLSHLLERLQGSFQARTAHLNLQLEWQVPPNDVVLSHEVTRSALSLERMMTELLNNACKYTPSGGTIQFQVEILALDDRLAPDFAPKNAPWLKVLVRNEGEIQPDALPYIFNKFYRGRESLADSPPTERLSSDYIPGTGLGLSVVRQLTHQLGGKLEVDSQHGWTTFTLCLPIA